MPPHPLCDATVKEAIEHAASDHLGRPWTTMGFTDLSDLASHSSGILHGESFSVFAKLATDANGAARFRAERDGLTLLRQRAGVTTPEAIGPGTFSLDHRSLMLSEALSGRRPELRTAEDWRSMGSTLAKVHRVHGPRFGLEEFDGFYGPLPQDNSPVTSNGWVEFFTERRLRPMLRSAVDAGNLHPDLGHGVEDVIRRLPLLCGPEPRPTLLHGDAQQHNFVSTDSGAVVIDVAPYFGHPEMDLAQIDVYNPAPPEVLDAYRDVLTIEAGFEDRRELWRMFCYLAVATVDAGSSFGRRMAASLSDAIHRYR